MTKARSNILIIDDDAQIRELLRQLLSAEFECQEVASAEAALTLLGHTKFNLVICDIHMGGISGLDLVPQILKRSPETVVVMVSGEHGIEVALGAMRVGAFDYITKPLDLRHVQAAVDRALDHHQLLVEKKRYEEHLGELVRERTARIEHLAYHDRLTDLPNRAQFVVRCEEALSSARAQQTGGAVMLVSLDRLKRITDTLGHVAGDVLITSAAARMQTCLRQGDLLARFDFDEFGILPGELRDAAAVADVAELARALAEAMKPAFHLGDGQEVFITASIGINLFSATGEDAVQIMGNAGAALDRAKQHGGNNYQFYTPEMSALTLKRLGMETNLCRAVESNQFVTYYQPIVSLASGKPVGVEALVRWEHPRLGLIPPGDFIGLAEDTGLILDIGNLVMNTACAQTRRWQLDGYGRLFVAINVSARQFRERSFAERLIDILAEARLDPQSVELEITETTIMETQDSVIGVLSDLRRLGIRVAIDDFGTGYSSLSYLKHLPIDKVKLDRSFVMEATRDPKDAALVMAIINLAHSLNLTVIAEGVETAEQRDFLRLLKCDEAQGYFFGRPVPADVLESSLRGSPQRKSNVQSSLAGDRKMGPALRIESRR